MAVKPVTIEHAARVVNLAVGERVIGVSLRRELPFGGIKIRPSNVTAAIATEVNDPDPSSNVIKGLDGSFPLGNTSYDEGRIVSFVQDAGQTIDIDTGDEVRLVVRNLTNPTSAEIFAFANNYVEGVVSQIFASGLINIRVVRLVGSITPAGAAYVIRVDHSEEHEPDYILLHNSSKGGFSQEFVAPAGGVYRVNGAIDKVITTT